MLANVFVMLGQFVAQGLFGVGSARSQLRQSINHITAQMKTVEIISDRHVEGGGGSAFLFESAHMQIFMIGPAIGQPVDQGWIAVKGEDNRFVYCEQYIEFFIV